MTNKPLFKDFIKHRLKRRTLRTLIKFIQIYTSPGCFLVYFVFSLIYYGLGNGILISFLTWLMFVFCTPIADAGFLLYFPIRLINGLRMIYSEILVWSIALLLNVCLLILLPQIYEKTFLLNLFKTLLLNPISIWLIIALFIAGTFLSARTFSLIYFGDKFIDITNFKEQRKYKKHKNKHISIIKHRNIIVLFSILLTILLYYHILDKQRVKM